MEGGISIDKMTRRVSSSKTDDITKQMAEIHKNTMKSASEISQMIEDNKEMRKELIEMRSMLSEIFNYVRRRDNPYSSDNEIFSPSKKLKTDTPKNEENRVVSLAGVTVAMLIEMWYEREWCLSENLNQGVPNRTVKDKIKQVMRFIEANVIQENEIEAFSQRIVDPDGAEENGYKQQLASLSQLVSSRMFSRLRELEEQHLGKFKVSRQPNVASAYDRLLMLKPYFT